MAKIEKIDNKMNFAIENAKLTYESDISWGYKFENENICVDFYQDEQGKNIVESFSYKFKNLWLQIVPTDAQVKEMFKKLNDTPYREVEEEIYSETDSYESLGINPRDFY